MDNTIFPNKKYNVIYADPPWSYNDKMMDEKIKFGVDYHYQTQSIEWIKSLPVKNIADDNCCLFIWVVSPLLIEGIDVLKTWGFKYKTIAFVWNKKTVTGKNVSNLGRWTMGSTEICLLGTKGKMERKNRNIHQLVESQRTYHSRKPHEVRKRIVKLFYNNVERIELFARQNVVGWDVWGNEVEKFNIKKGADVFF